MSHAEADRALAVLRSTTALAEAITGSASMIVYDAPPELFDAARRAGFEPHPYTNDKGTRDCVFVGSLSIHGRPCFGHGEICATDGCEVAR